VSNERAALALLVALTLGALGLRAVGLDFGVPVWEEPDAVIAMHVDKLRSGSTRADRRWSDQEYPHLVARLTRPFAERPPADGPGAPRTLDEHLEAAAHTHVQVRGVVAALSVLLVPAAYLLGRRFLGAGGGVLAAALTGTSLLLFSFSQQGRPHAPAASLFLCSVLASMRLVRRSGTVDFALAGLAAAAAIGTLHTGVFVLLPLALAFALRAAPAGRRWLDGRALIPLGLVALAVWLLYPFLFGGQLGDEFGLPEVEGQRLVLAEHAIEARQFLHGGGFRVVALSLWAYDPLLTALGAAGALGWLASRLRGARSEHGRELLVALSFVLPYLIVIGMFQWTYERFAIPLLPYLAAAAAWGVRGLARRFGRGVWVAATAVVLVTGAGCAKLAWLRGQPDTLELATAWLGANTRPSEPVFLGSALELPLFRVDAELHRPDGKRQQLVSPWTRYQARVPAENVPETVWNLRSMIPRSPSERRLLAQDEDAFIASFGPGLYVIEPYVERAVFRAEVRLREFLIEHGEQVARWTPEGPDGNIEYPFFFMLSDHFNEAGRGTWPHFARRLVGARAVGPALEVYRVE
jgi:hypothetical protein